MRKFLLVLVVLGLIGLAGDRVAHRLATDAAASRLSQHGLAAATVEVGGFPFLDQLLARQFDEVSVAGASFESDAGNAGRVDLTARDVTGPSGGEVTVGQLSGSATVSYAEVLRQVDHKGLRLSSAGDGKVRLGRDVTVLGRTVSATAVGRVEPHGRRLRVVPTGIELTDGGAVDGALAGLLADRFAIDYRLPDLPRGLTVERVVPTAHGFDVGVSGRDLSFAYAG